jgi:hypothetical protein
MKTFTDDEMNALLARAKAYSVVILRGGPNYGSDGAAPIVREGVFTFEVHPVLGFPGDALP